VRLRSPVGAVAQLGERLTGSQKVTGSIPVGSTKNPPASGSRRAGPEWPLQTAADASALIKGC
jgi:hypothetical protein